MTYKFIGKNTAMNQTYRAEAESFEGLFRKLVDQGVMHHDDLEAYISDEYGVFNDDYDWENDPKAYEKYDDAFENAVMKMADEDWLDVMARSNGNAYYQEVYNENGERVA